MKDSTLGLKIVSVGGGTGLSTLLSGLKAFVWKESLSSTEPDAGWIETLKAVVTVTLFEYSPNLELDYVIVNTTHISAALREKYLADGAAQVEFDSLGRQGFEDELHAAFIETPERVHAFQLLCRDVLREDGLVRHDSDKLARLVLETRQAAKLAAESTAAD